MTIESFALSVALAAVILAGLAVLVGASAFVLALSMKLSTHQVVWKGLDEKEEDPFQEEMPEFDIPPEPFPGENPNKRHRRDDEEEDLADLSDPEITSNNW